MVDISQTYFYKGTNSVGFNRNICPQSLRESFFFCWTQLESSPPCHVIPRNTSARFFCAYETVEEEVQTRGNPECNWLSLTVVTVVHINKAGRQALPLSAETLVLRNHFSVVQ